MSSDLLLAVAVLILSIVMASESFVNGLKWRFVFFVFLIGINAALIMAQLLRVGR